MQYPLPCSEAAAARTAADDAPAPWWKCVVAALPELLVGMQFLVIALQRKPFLGASSRTLTTFMQAEFLVMHSMAFLGFVALWKPGDRNGRRFRAVLFWGLFGLYCALAISNGFAYFAIFFGLTFVTYLGLFMNWNSPSAMLQLGGRYALGFAIFILAIGIFDTPKNVSDWSGRASVIKAGALYFLGIATLELSGLYLRVIPRNAEAIYGWLRRAKRDRPG